MDSLKLTVLQGPNKGVNRIFKPGSQIRIGRVVRGNNLTIKDSGISSKHLSIGFESGKWVLRDLDSSNGTILNATRVVPNTPFDIRHADVIKIGELTSVLVGFVGEEENGALEEVRKGAGRGRKVGVVESRNEDEERVVGLPIGGVEEGRKTRGRGKVLRNVTFVEPRDEGFDGGKESRKEEELEVGVGRSTRGGRDVGGLVLEKKAAASPRRTSSKKNEVNLVSDSDVEKVAESSVLGCEEVAIGGRLTRAGVRGRMRRNAREVDEKVGEKAGDVVKEGDGDKRKRGRPRKTRGNAKEIEESSDKLEAGEKAVVVKEEVEVGEDLSLRDGAVGITGEGKQNEKEVAFGERNRVDVSSNEENAAVLEFTGQNKKASCDNVLNLGETEAEGMMREHPVEEGCNKIDDGSSERVEVNFGNAGKDCGPGARENMGSDCKSFDLEKTTLGEWLDHLEVSLCKEIIDATEDMIKGMEQKAERVCEYIEQQKK